MRTIFGQNGDRGNLGRSGCASTGHRRKRRRSNRWVLTSAALITMVSAVLVGWTFFVPQSARAVIFLNYRLCDTGYVVIQGFAYPTRTCWFETLTFPDAPPPSGVPEDDPVPWDPWSPSFSYPPALPDTDCVEARVNEYGHYKQQDAVIVYEPKWAFIKSIGPKEYYYSPWSKQQPPGYKWVLGTTSHYPGPAEEALVKIYRGAYDPLWNLSTATLPYEDPETGQDQFLPGPIPPDEMLTIVLEHEFGHASSSGESEDELTGRGVKTVEAYRADPNADPCD